MGYKRSPGAPALRKINLGVLVRELEVYAEDAGNANRSVSLPPDTVFAVARHLLEGYSLVRELASIVRQHGGMTHADLKAKLADLDRRTADHHEIEVV